MYNNFLEMNREEFKAMAMELTLKKIAEIAVEYQITVNTKTKKTVAVAQLVAEFEILQAEQAVEEETNTCDSNSALDEESLSSIVAMQEKLSELGVQVMPMRDNFFFSGRVELTCERNFEVTYDIETREFALATTFSNQVLDEDYLKLLMKISNVINGNENRTTSKYGVGTTHMTAKGEIEITKVFLENGVEMIEYKIGNDFKINKKVNVVSNIHKFAKRAN